MVGVEFSNGGPLFELQGLKNVGGGSARGLGETPSSRSSDSGDKKKHQGSFRAQGVFLPWKPMYVPTC